MTRFDAVSTFVRGLQAVFLSRFEKDTLYIHESVDNTPPFSGSKRVAEFILGPGQWVIIAKASAKGYGGNSGLADCRLMIVGSEGAITSSDESYGSPAPLLGTTMTVMLPFKVARIAEFHLHAAVQGQPAEFLHIVLAAVREKNVF